MKNTSLTLRVLSLLLLLAILLPMAVACKKDPVDAPKDDPSTDEDEDFTLEFEEVNPDNGFDPILRFLVTSDLHLRSAKSEPDLQSNENLKKLYETAYAYAESQGYKNLDGIFFAGDFTQNGSENEMKDFFDYVNAATKEGSSTYVTLGNHEYWTSGYKYRAEEGTRYGPKSIAETYERLLKYSGYDSVDQHIVIGGYHFLLLNMDRYNDDYTGSKYSPAKLSWLDTELAAAAADDPTGKKPIFIFNHMPATGTVNKTGPSASDDNLEAIFNKYPQAVDFSGHTHLPITDPRSVWQKGYTAINTASLAYLGSTIAGHSQYENDAVIALNNQGAWADGDIEKSVRNGGLYYFVEVNAKNEIRLVVSNIYDGKLQAIIEIGTVGDTAAFRYTDAQRNKTEKPVFSANAKPKVSSTFKTGAIIRIPQASCSDYVNSYRVEIYQGSSRKATVYRLACQYLGTSMPAYVTAPVSGLKAGTEYTAKIYALSHWGAESEPVTVSFKTAMENSLVPDLFSVEFNDDGTATDLISGNTLGMTGKPTVSNDLQLGCNVASFNGNSAYTFDGIADYYDLLADGFTLEAYTYVTAPPRYNYVNTVSNQQGGGFGFEYSSDGKMHIYCNVNGQYYNASANMPTNEWVHLMGTFDGKRLTLYINGEIAGVADAAGEMTPPPYAAQFLCIGGDSNEGSCDQFMTGKIGSVALYSEALTASQVMAFFNGNAE